MNPAQLTPFFPLKEFLWTSAAAAAATHKIIRRSEKCKTKCHIFGLLSVTSVKCTHAWIAPVYFLGMVKNEEIVTILEHFRSLFLLLFLLNGENTFIFGYFKGEIFQMFGFATASPLFLLLILFSLFSSSEKSRKFSSEVLGESVCGGGGGGREKEKTGNAVYFKVYDKWQIVSCRWTFSVKKLCKMFEKADKEGGNTKSNTFPVLAWLWEAGGTLAVGTGLPSPCCSAAKPSSNASLFWENWDRSVKELKAEPWAVGEPGLSHRQG